MATAYLKHLIAKTVVEVNFQIYKGRLTAMTKKHTHMLCLPDIPGMSSSRLRNNGQSPLSLRAPVKAVTPVVPMAPSRLPAVHVPPSGGGRRIQSPGPSNGVTYVPGRASAGSGRPPVSRGQAVSSTRSKLAQPPRR